MRRSGLPPLDLLLPFEASARHASFTRAAEELSVTQSAVSQRVRSLEAFLGTKLFLRKHRSIELTDAGRELFNGAKIAIQHLNAASQSIQRQDKRPVVKLGVDASIGAHWIQPRLKTFLAQNCNLAVDLLISDEESEILNADVVVLHGDGKWPGFTSWRLFGDAIFPVCAPEYLANHNLRTREDLLAADLIDLDYTQWDWINWGIWLTELNLDPANASIVLRTNSYPAQIDAARHGLGVALGWENLVEDELKSGVLVRPIPDQVETQFGYHALVRQGAGDHADALVTHLKASALI